jgi:crotonobetainyl-CoA:carnitine CoA-transferase CaiB-like acyl-CoA transferase
VNHPDAGTHLLSGPIWKLDGAPEPLHQPAPCLGQDNNYILGRVLGLSDDALNSLEEKSVIGTVPLEGADMGGVRRIQRAT